MTTSTGTGFMYTQPGLPQSSGKGTGVLWWHGCSAGLAAAACKHLPAGVISRKAAIRNAVTILDLAFIRCLARCCAKKMPRPFAHKFFVSRTITTNEFAFGSNGAGLGASWVEVRDSMPWAQPGLRVLKLEAKQPKQLQG